MDVFARWSLSRRVRVLVSSGASGHSGLLLTRNMPDTPAAAGGEQQQNAGGGIWSTVQVLFWPSLPSSQSQHKKFSEA
jgi:hypothetical protein